MTTEKALREALNCMLTYMGMDEEEWNKPVFDQARAALSLPETQGEPVAWRFMVDGTWFVGATLEICTKNLEGVVPMSKPEPLFAAPPSQPAQGWKLVPEEPPLVCLRHGMADITPPCRKWCGSASCTPPTQAKPTNGEGA